MVCQSLAIRNSIALQHSAIKRQHERLSVRKITQTPHNTADGADLWACDPWNTRSWSWKREEAFSPYRYTKKQLEIKPFAELAGTIHWKKAAWIVRLHGEEKQGGKIVFLANLGGFVEIHRGKQLLYNDLVEIVGNWSTALLSTKTADAFLVYFKRKYLSYTKKLTLLCD